MSTLDRRNFIHLLGGGLASGVCFASPLTSALFPEDEPERILVLLTLAGGNDGLSMVVPYADDAYGRNRKRTLIPESELLKLDDYRGLHPRLKLLEPLYKEGELAIVEGVGYSNPNRSHFKSMDIWQAADMQGRNRGYGWLGRYLDYSARENSNPALAVHIGQQSSFALASAAHPPLAFATPLAYKWVGIPREEQALRDAAPICEHGEIAPPKESTPNSGRDQALQRLRATLREAQASSDAVRQAAADYRPRTRWPSNPLAAQLATVTALMASKVGTRVYSVTATGFDTHNNQRTRHDQLMSVLDASLGTFWKELDQRGLADRATVLVHSEFGRRVAENGSGGTDHGTAGPMMILGKKVRGGLHGKHPDLTNLRRGDLVHTTDFRTVYASVLEEFLGCPSKPILGSHAPLKLFRT